MSLHREWFTQLVAAHGQKKLWSPAEWMPHISQDLLVLQQKGPPCPITSYHNVYWTSCNSCWPKLFQESWVQVRIHSVILLPQRRLISPSSETLGIFSGVLCLQTAVCFRGGWSHIWSQKMCFGWILVSGAQPFPSYAALKFDIPGWAGSSVAQHLLSINNTFSSVPIMEK